MSYEIVYDRKYIKVNDKFVPLVQTGSNNSWEVNCFGRDIPEKNWGVWNYPQKTKYLFTVKEVQKLAEQYKQPIDTIKKHVIKILNKVNYIAISLMV